ncbi:hypothetical protein MBLNU457_4486t1 [Dothideomycetes sp. NU457]
MSPSTQGPLPPVVVHNRTYSSSSPASSTPASPSSPRNVHFLPAMSPVSGITRPLNRTEAWSLYHFEKHAESCRQCYRPESVFNSGRPLCEVGHDLARDVLLHIRMSDDVVYSTTREDHRWVRVEMQPDYCHTRGLLRAMERKRRQVAAKNRPATTSTTTTTSTPTVSTKPARDTRTDSVMGRVGEREADKDMRTEDRRRSRDVTVEFAKSTKQRSRSKERRPREDEDTKRSERRGREKKEKTSEGKGSRIEIQVPDRTRDRTKVYYY